VGAVPAGQTKQVQVTASGGVMLGETVSQNGSRFQSAVQQRQSAFGESSAGRLDDLPEASVAASFVTQVTRNQGGWNFVAPPGLDLSQTVERGNAVLLAWTPDYGPVKTMNQFTPRRSARQTLWRVPVDLNPRP